MVLPANGADGGAPAPQPDGCTFDKATYLGVPVTQTTLTFPVGGTVQHPYAVDNTGAPLVVSGTPGDQLVVLLMPFGSFAPAQPPAPVKATLNCSNLANLDEPLPVTVKAGFHYGADALDNPAADPSLVGTTATQNLTPKLIELTKTYIGPEDETATGPSFKRCYQIDVHIAPGQTISALKITDELAVEIQFLRVLDADNIDGSACPGAKPTTLGHTDTATPSPTTPGGTITTNVGDITADSDVETADATLLFEFFVPQRDASNSEVLPTDSGDDKDSPDQAYAKGDWTPIDGDDPQTVAAAEINGTDIGGPEHTLEDQSIAIQKTVEVVGGGALKPGSILKYTVNFQVSDYFAFDDVHITDVLSDGQRLCGFSGSSNSVACTDPGIPDFTPTLTYASHGTALPELAIVPGHLNISGCYSPSGVPGPKPGTNSACDDPTLNSTNSPLAGGETVLDLNLSSELLARGVSNGRLIGGCVPDAGGNADCNVYTTADSGATTGTLVFYAEVQDTFTDVPPGTANQDSNLSVDHGDVLINDADIDGRVLNTTTLATQACTASLEDTGGVCREADDTAAEVVMDFGQQAKLIYAVNAAIATDPDAGYADNPNDPNDGPQLKPGEVVTYQISYTLPFTDFDDLKLTDYLPMPTLSAAGLHFDPLKPRCSDYGNPAALAKNVVCFKTQALSGEGTVDTFYDYATANGYSILPGDFFTTDPRPRQQRGHLQIQLLQ